MIYMYINIILHEKVKVDANYVGSMGFIFSELDKVQYYAKQ